MKFDPGKAWPHPVLRPSIYGDDYPRAEFEVEIDLKRGKGSTSIDMNAEFELSAPTLLQLVKQGKARFSLLVKAPRTHFRKLFQSASKNIKQTFSAGKLSGRVEFSPFLVSIQRLSNFQADEWHSDFRGRTYNIPAGAVLAEYDPKDYWVDTADEAPLGSIFGHKRRPDLDDDCWKCELLAERIWIVMSEADAIKYEIARERANNKPEAQYLMNGLYLPALVAVLNEIDRAPEEYRDYRWFAFLDQRLEEVGCKPLGHEGAAIDRLTDAQKVLEFPFARMPLIANERPRDS